MTRDSDVEVLNKVLEDESNTKDYIVETDHGTITFSMERASRTRRHAFIDALPDSLVEFMNEKARDRREDLDVNEISSLDDLSEAEPEDAPSDTEMTEEAVAEMEEFIVEHLQHNQITNSELRDFMEHWPDRQFFATSFLILGISGESGGVADFRLDG